ncbi:MAG: peroxiredoxin, partial [Planctomycetota bacterium]
MQLQENLQAFTDVGIGVVGITYDKPDLQQQFIENRGIDYPFLSDVEAYTMKALGIL